MFANRYTALIDTNVLAASLKRNIILRLAQAELFRARWSSQVMAELPKALNAILKADEARQRSEKIARLLSAINRAFPEAEISDAAPLPEELLSQLPDASDAHLLAAARQVSASVIVTENLKDFPSAACEPLGLEIRTSDAFIADTIDLSQHDAIAALRRMRLSFNRPEMTAAMLISRMEAVGLVQSKALIAEYEELL